MRIFGLVFRHDFERFLRFSENEVFFHAFYGINLILQVSPRVFARLSVFETTLPFRGLTVVVPQAELASRFLKLCKLIEVFVSRGHSLSKLTAEFKSRKELLGRMRSNTSLARFASLLFCPKFCFTLSWIRLRSDAGSFRKES